MTPPADDRLDSWKEIAAYLRKGVRTVQRWEQSEGLPVRRLGQDRQGSVFAYKGEIDAWWEARSRKPVEAAAPPKAPGRGRRWVAVGVVGLMVAIAGWRIWPSNPTMPRAIPLTADHGSETTPAFSPDGRQIAYTAATPGGRPQVFVKAIGSDTARRLTSGDETDGFPVWSPDGRRIAFLRLLRPNRKFALKWRALEGGEERQVAELPLTTVLWWSADGHWILAVDGPVKQRSIVAFGVEDGTRRVLTEPYEFGYAGFGLSPDGRRLIYALDGPGAVPVLEKPLGPGLTPAGAPREITERLWLGGMRVAPDAGEILFADGSWEEGSLWRRKFSLGAKPELVYRTTDRVAMPAISADGRRIVFSARHPGREEIWQKPLTGDGPATALLSSTHSDMNPHFSPDGRFVAFHSTRTGASDIWVAQADGSNPRRLTFTNARTTATPRWSPDGEWIAYESNQPGQSEVYVIASRGGTPRRLTDHPAIDAIPRWSRDGKSLYFCSNRTGRYEVWKVAAGGGEPEQVTKDGGFVAIESPDGKYLYYSQTRNFGPVWRRPMGGGAAEEVIPEIRGLFFAVTPDGVYYALQRSIQFWDAAERRATVVFEPEKNTDVGLDVSPDGKTLLFTQVVDEGGGADLYIIERMW